MTLLEIIIVLAIIGMAMALGTMAVSHIRKSSLRQDTTQMAQVLRAAREMALLSGKPHRVIMDLDHQTFRIEQCPEQVPLRKLREEAAPADNPEQSPEMAQAEATMQTAGIPPELLANVEPEQAKKLAAALAAQPLGEAGAGAPGAVCMVPTTPNGDFDGRGNQREMNTEDDIKIRRVLVQHLDRPATEGLATINFFPMGNAEKAMVVVGDDDGNFYSVLVHPFTGRVEVKKGEVDEDEFMHRDAAGDKEEER